MKVACWLVGIGLLLAAPVAQAEPRVVGLEVEVEDNQVLLSFRLDGALDERFLERVESGLPTGVVYRFELQGDRKRWFDKTLKRSTLQVVAMYDAIEEEYLVNLKLDGKLVESRMVRDLEELARVLTRFERVPVFGLQDVPRRWRLQVRLRAELGSKTILSMIPAKIHTDWIASAKFRSPNPLP